LLNFKAGAIAVFSKFNLGMPYKNSSIDFKLRQELCSSTGQLCQYDDWREEQLQSLISNKVDHKRAVTDRVWDSDQFQLRAVPFYLVAGLSALPAETPDAQKEKLKIIELGVHELCSNAFTDRVEHLAIPVFGSGTASVRYREALGAIIHGINKVIDNGEAL